MSVETNATIAALLGSRICHDLISPIGAIGNGVELLNMTGAQAGLELSLISESVENASSSISFFSVAFGAATKGQQISRGEIISTLHNYTKSSRTRIEWRAEGNPPRMCAKLVFLLVQ